MCSSAYAGSVPRASRCGTLGCVTRTSSRRSFLALCAVVRRQGATGCVPRLSLAAFLALRAVVRSRCGTLGCVTRTSCCVTAGCVPRLSPAVHSAALLALRAALRSPGEQNPHYRVAEERSPEDTNGRHGRRPPIVRILFSAAAHDARGAAWAVRVGGYQALVAGNDAGVHPIEVDALPLPVVWFAVVGKEHHFPVQVDAALCAACSRSRTSFQNEPWH